MFDNLDEKHKKIAIIAGLGLVLGVGVLFVRGRSSSSSSSSNSLNSTDPTAQYSTGGTLYIPTSAYTYNYADNGSTIGAYTNPVQPTSPTNGQAPTPTPTPTPVSPTSGGSTGNGSGSSSTGSTVVSTPTTSPVPTPSVPAAHTSGVLNSQGVVVDKTPSGKVVTGTSYAATVNAAGGLYQNHVWTPGSYVGNTFVPSTANTHASASGQTSVVTGAGKHMQAV